MLRMLSMTTLFGLLTTSASYAQSGQPIQARVPFAFMVQNMTLLAGNYQVTYNNSAHRLFIRGLDQNSTGAFVTAEPMTASGAYSRPGRLVFDCYGKSCYLAQVWQGSLGGDRGLEVRQTEGQHALSMATRLVAVTIPAK